MTDNANLYTTTAADFDTRVLSASAQRPVLVDFWAAWCGPCRSIAPLLEQLVEHFGGKLAVAKVDTDAEQALAARYGIRSLPTLILFKHGAPVEQVVGAQPLQAFVALVTRHLDRDSDRARAAAAQALAAGDRAEARRLLEDAWRDDADNTRIHPELAALLIDDGALELAATVLDSVPSRALNEAVTRQQARLRFAHLAADAPATAVLQQAVDGGDASSGTRFQWAIRRALDGDCEAALATLLAIVRSDRRYGDDAARKAMLDLFTLLPDGDPLIREYRTQLARALN